MTIPSEQNETDFTPIQTVIEKGEKASTAEIRSAVDRLYEHYTPEEEWLNPCDHDDISLGEWWTDFLEQRYSVGSYGKHIKEAEEHLNFLLRDTIIWDKEQLKQVGESLQPNLKTANIPTVTKYEHTEWEKHSEVWTKPFFKYARELIQRALTKYNGNPDQAVRDPEKCDDHKMTISKLLFLTYQIKSKYVPELYKGRLNREDGKWVNY